MRMIGCRRETGKALTQSVGCKTHTVLFVLRLVLSFFITDGFRKSSAHDSIPDITISIDSLEAALASIQPYHIYVRDRTEIFLVREWLRTQRGRQIDIGQDAPEPPLDDWVPANNEERGPFQWTLTRQWRSAQRYRVDLLQKDGETLPLNGNTTIWSNGVETQVDLGTNSAIVTHSSRSSSNARGFFYTNLYDTVEGGSLTFPTFLRHRFPDHITVEANNNEVVFKAEAVPGGIFHSATRGVILHCDVRKGMMPHRIYFTANVENRKNVVMRSITNELQDVGDGCWMPIRARVVDYHWNIPSSPHFGKEICAIEIEVLMDQSQFNAAIPEERFKPDLPAGVVVNDETRGVQYTVGASSDEEYLKRLATQGRLGAEELSKNPGRLVRTQSTRAPSRRRLLIVANLAVAAVIVAFLSWRWLRSREQE